MRRATYELAVIKLVSKCCPHISGAGLVTPGVDRQLGYLVPESERPRGDRGCIVFQHSSDDQEDELEERLVGWANSVAAGGAIGDEVDEVGEWAEGDIPEDSGDESEENASEESTIDRRRPPFISICKRSGGGSTNRKALAAEFH